MLVDQMSSLLDDTSTFEPWTLTGPELREVLDEAARVKTGIDAFISSLTAAADGMGLPKEDGGTSTTVWLANRTGIPKGEAAKLMSMAKVTTSYTETTRRQWATGELSTAKASVIMKAIHDLPDWVDDEPRHDAETQLLKLATDFNVDDLKRLANRVLEVIDPDGADEVLGEKLRQQEQQALKSTTMAFQNRGDGTTRGSFTIPTADADILRAAIQGIINPRRANQNAIHLGIEPDDYNAWPRPQKMGHAFIELIIPAAMRSCAGAHYLPTEALPKAGRLAATVAVTIDIDNLRTGRGYATTTTGTDVSATRAQPMACNAHLVALYLDGDNRVLDHGMTRRLYDRHQRLALAVRDKGCVWAGCDRPPAWCEAHHLDSWSENGPTDLNNAALVCHFHHTLLHEGHWTAHMASDGVVEVIPPAHIDPHQRPRRHARFTQQQPRPG